MAKGKGSAVLTLDKMLARLDLIALSVRGIAHRGANGDITDALDESLPVEGLIDEVRENAGTRAGRVAGSHAGRAGGLMNLRAIGPVTVAIWPGRSRE
jgi:hypothetical protein